MATGRIGTTPVLTTRWSKAPAAGTTSLSGLDDNSVSLVYSVGYEQVYLNGALLSRTNDYTATNGTTITLTNATVAGDIVEVFANAVVPLTDTYTQSVANGKFINNTLTTTTGDIIYASAANTPARLGIGSTNQVLTVSGGVPTWATPSSGGMTLISTTALTGSSVTLSSIPQTYNELQLWVENFDPSQSARFRIAPNAGTTASDNVTLEYAGGGTATTQGYQGYMRTYNQFNTTPTNTIIAVFPFYTSTAGRKSAYMTSGFLDGGGGNRTEATFCKLESGAITSLVLSPDAGTFSGGTAYLYGVK